MYKRRKIMPAILSVCLLFCAGCLQAQDSARSNISPFSFRADFQHLRSTHATIFNGVSANGDYNVSPHFSVGLGVQYAGTHLHNDNGWVLTNLKLLPVYTSQIYTFLPTHRVQPYIHSEEGISFNRYDKLDPVVVPHPFKVSEEGLYLAGNGGVDIVLLKHLKVFTELGYKGYKHSANDLDVNPHGLTTRLGIEL